MIGRLNGILLAKQPPIFLVDVNGVGYEVEAPLTVFYDLPETGQPVSVITHLAIKDDAHTLYGFLKERERALFRSLLKVSGIGAKLALTILSGISADELARLLESGDDSALTKLPGIGKKTAQRLIIELRDKLGDLPQGVAGEIASQSDKLEPAQEAISALESLGYKRAIAERMIRAVADDGLSTEALIRAALKTRVTA